MLVVFKKYLNANVEPRKGMSDIKERHDVSTEGFDLSNLICLKFKMILHSLIIRRCAIGS